jgi:simple sugar transport system permease protein
MDADFFIGLSSLALVKAAPIAFGAMCGLMCERSGVINIGIEGMMLVGAMMSFLGSILFHDLTGGSLPVDVSLLAGLLVAMLSAGLIAALHALLSIHYKVDQIISGTVINLLALGITNFTTSAFIDRIHLAGVGVFSSIQIPVLSQIPILGRVLFMHQPLVYVMLILVGVLQYALFHSPWGLRTRAVGEHPRAADTVGIKVLRTRYVNVILGGLLAGMGGAFLVIENVGRFEKFMTTGRGFIALAALIFGKWTSVGAFLSALLFGFSEALGVRLQFRDVNELQTLLFLIGAGVVGLVIVRAVLQRIRPTEETRSGPWSLVALGIGAAMVAVAVWVELPNLAVPVQFLGLLPYVVTLLVVAGLVGRATPPAAIGKPYEKQ